MRLLSCCTARVRSNRIIAIALLYRLLTHCTIGIGPPSEAPSNHRTSSHPVPRPRFTGPSEDPIHGMIHGTIGSSLCGLWPLVMLAPPQAATSLSVMGSTPTPSAATSASPSCQAGLARRDHRCARRRFHDHPPHPREADVASRRH